MPLRRTDRHLSRRGAGVGALVVAALLTMSLPGCRRGPTVVPVQGVVEVDGKPLPSGAVMVVPRDGRPASATIGPDGRFTLSTYKPGDGAILGTHPVVVIAHESIGGSKLRWLVPAACRDIATSPLRLEVTGPLPSAKISISTDGQPLEVKDMSVTGDIAPDGSLSR